MSLGLAASLLGPAAAQTLRWASASDALSMDPHAALDRVTANLNRLCYDSLIDYDRELRPIAGLALRWERLDPLRWRFHLRRGVRFHDGTPFTAADAVFSIERAQQADSPLSGLAAPLGRAVRIDDWTIDLRLAAPNPRLLQYLVPVSMISRAWTLNHGAARVPRLQGGDEGYTTTRAMGTGRYRLLQREPGVRTVLARHAQWWGRPEGNVERIVFLPMAQAAARTAALMAGDVDLVQDVPPQDVERLARDPAVRIERRPENVLVYLGYDHSREPFDDPRVRRALQLAVDTAALQSAVMRGQSEPTGCLATSARGCRAPELQAPVAAEPIRARALLAEAGRAKGLAVTLDCPSDRYVNDAALCTAIAGQLARVGIAVAVDAQPSSRHLGKLQRGETRFYLHGWGGSMTDPQFLIDALLHTPQPATHRGAHNRGRYANPAVDRLVEAAAVAPDGAARDALIADVQRRAAEDLAYLPLHRQTTLWAARRAVHPAVMANNMVRADWVRIDDEPPR